MCACREKHTTPRDWCWYHCRFWFARTSGLKFDLEPSSRGGGTQFQALCIWCIHLWKLLLRWCLELRTFERLGRWLGASSPGAPPASSEALLEETNDVDAGPPPVSATSIIPPLTQSSHFHALNIPLPLPIPQSKLPPKSILFNR